MRRLLITQFLLTCTGAVISSVYFGQEAVIPAFFGGALTMVNTLLMARRLNDAGAMAEIDPQQGMISLYVGVLQRIIVALIGFGLGLGVLKLMPIPMIGTFMLTQLAFVFAGARQP